MILAKIRVSGVRALPVDVLDIPKGIIGGKVAFKYTAPMWDGLTKTVVFRGSGVTKDVLNAGEVVEVPPEVVERAGLSLLVGVYGTDADGNRAIPTIWTDLGRIRGAADPSGDESTDPQLPVWAQLEGRVKNLEKQGGDTVSEETVRQIVDDYLETHPPAAASITINGEEADENGNFVINTVSDVEIARLAAALT